MEGTMNKLLSFVIGGFLFAGAGAAQATPPIWQPSVQPTVRNQIMDNAKTAGATKGIVRPSLRLETNGNTVKAKIYGMGYEGPFRPGQVKTRILMDTATFTLEQGREGKVAVPVKDQFGTTWSPVMRALATTPAP
jgi:hypothetical protein